MGILSADLARYRTEARTPAAFGKRASAPPPAPAPLDDLRTALERYAGADGALAKSAEVVDPHSEPDYGRLFTLHGAVERAYRAAVKVGKRPEADAQLSKFAGWSYLKGHPGEPGDMHPFPVPGDK